MSIDISTVFYIIMMYVAFKLLRGAVRTVRRLVSLLITLVYLYIKYKDVVHAVVFRG